MMQNKVAVLLVLSLCMQFVAPGIAASHFRTDDYNYSDNSDYTEEDLDDMRKDDRSMGHSMDTASLKGNHCVDSDADDEAGARNKREALTKHHANPESLKKFATRSEPLAMDDEQQQQKMIDETFLRAYNQFIANQGAPIKDVLVRQAAPNKEQYNRVPFAEKVMDSCRAPAKNEESQQTSHLSARSHHNNKIRIKKGMQTKTHNREYKHEHAPHGKFIKTRQVPITNHGTGDSYDNTLRKLNKRFLRSKGAPTPDPDIDLEKLLKRLKQPLSESQKPTAIPAVVTIPPIFRKGDTDLNAYSGAVAPDWKSEFVVPFEDDSYDR